MLYIDGNGFPLTVKPSHLFGSTERMDTAEVLAMIVEQACLYVPETPAGIKNVKRMKALTEMEKVPKEEFSDVVKVPKEALTVVKVPVVAASDLVRNEIVLN